MINAKSTVIFLSYMLFVDVAIADGMDFGSFLKQAQKELKKIEEQVKEPSNNKVDNGADDAKRLEEEQAKREKQRAEEAAAKKAAALKRKQEQDAKERQRAKAKLESLKAKGRSGDAEASFTLGEMYYSGKEGVSKDRKEALKWYTIAANKGHVESQYSLGYLYLHGQGTAKNEIAAKKWLKKAAAQGSELAMRELQPKLDCEGTYTNTNMRTYRIGQPYSAGTYMTVQPNQSAPTEITINGWNNIVNDLIVINPKLSEPGKTHAISTNSSNVSVATYKGHNLQYNVRLIYNPNESSVWVRWEDSEWQIQYRGTCKPRNGL